MSADDSHSATTPFVQLNPTHLPSPPDGITYIQAVNEIKSRINNASHRSVHIFSFNVHPEQLVSAYDLLDKEMERKLMRVTYSDDHNFIVRYMPSRAHEVTHVYWGHILSACLAGLAIPPQLLPPGCVFTGATTIHLGPRQKQADSGLGPHPNPSDIPSIALEVGCSESLTQLKIDARLWLEHVPEVRLVIILAIDPPIDPHPNLPRITIQLWRLMPPLRASRSQRGSGQMVWEADWTHASTPLYILFTDIFRGPAPAVYGVVNDRVHMDTALWRDFIIDSYT